MAIDWAAIGSAAKSVASSSAKQAAANMGSAAVASGGGLLSQIFFGAKNWKRTKELNRQTFEYNKDLAEQAFRQNVQMWNAENAYNSPAAQMMRMRAAGLNPNLLYGNGQEASAGLAGDAPNLQYGDYNPKVSYFDTNGGFQSINAALSASQLNAQLGVFRSQEELNTVRAALASKEAGLYDDFTNSRINNMNVDSMLKSVQIGNYEAMTQQIRTNIEKTGLEIKSLGLDLDYMPERLMLANMKSAAEVKEISERTQNYSAQRDQISKNIALMGAQYLLLGTQKNLTQEQVNEVKQRIENLKSENAGIEARSNISKTDAELIQEYGWLKYLHLLTSSIGNIF